MRLGIGLGLSGQRGASGPYIVLSTPSQQEGTAIGTTIGTLSVVGASTGSSGWTFAKTVDPDAAFTLTTATVKNAIVFDYDVATGGATSHIATYTATKAGDPASPITTQIRVSVTNDISDDPTVPAAPTLTATAGDGQVTLSWVDGSNGGSAITAHKLYRGTVSGTLTLVGTILSGSPYVDTGLTNGQAYYYKLSAVNAIGEGALSDEESATPAEVTYLTPSVTKVVVEGCSFEDANYEPLPAAVLANSVTLYNSAVGGSTFAAMTARLSAVEAQACDLAYVGGSGPNDLASMSVVDYLAAQNTYLALLKTKLTGGKLIGVPGLPPGLPSDGGVYTAKVREVNAANRAAAGTAGSPIDFYVARYEHPVTGRDSVAADPDMMADGLHPTGSAMINDAVATCTVPLTAIIAQAGQAPSSIPSDVADIVVGSAELNTVVSVRFVVPGLGIGKTAAYSIVSGPAKIAANLAGTDSSGHATGTSPVTVMCGDVVTITMTTANANETPVAATISDGTNSITATITTKSASGAIAEDTFNRSNGALGSTPVGSKTWFGPAQINSNKFQLGQVFNGYGAFDPGSGDLDTTWTGVELNTNGGANPSDIVYPMFGGHKVGSTGGAWADFDNIFYVNLHAGILYCKRGGTHFTSHTFSGFADGTYDVRVIAKVSDGSISLLVNGSPVTMTPGDFGNMFQGFPSGGNYVGAAEGANPRAVNVFDAISVSIAP